MAITFASTLSLHDALPILMLNGFFSVPSLMMARRLANRRRQKRWSKDVLPSTHNSPTSAGVARRVKRSVDELLRSEEHTSELQSRFDLVCRLLLEKKNQKI